MPNRKRIIFGDSEEGLDWVATYLLEVSEFDDSLSDSNQQEIILTAVDFDTAVRYAQQYLKKMQLEHADGWNEAELISVVLY